MTDKLTIKAGAESLDLRASRADYAAAFVRSVVGVAPVIGPAVAELVTVTIPNQKMERLVISIRVLEDRLKYVEEDLVKQAFQSEEFADLLEDAMPQMARALTDERKAYIANLLSTSITDDALDHIAQKKLLSILNALNDPEIVLLHFYALRRSGDAKSEQMLNEYPFISAALRAFDKDEPDEKEFMFRQYRHTLYTESLIMGPLENEYPSELGYLLLKYVQPGNASVQ
jgi:hypothetical protein